MTTILEFKEYLKEQFGDNFNMAAILNATTDLETYYLLSSDTNTGLCDFIKNNGKLNLVFDDIFNIYIYPNKGDTEKIIFQKTFNLNDQLSNNELLINYWYCFGATTNSENNKIIAHFSINENILEKINLSDLDVFSIKKEIEKFQTNNNK